MFHTRFFFELLNGRSMHKIMIVDDEKDLVAGLAMNFKREGYEVITAYDGESALRLATRDNPHLILLDVAMPGMSGLQVCRTLREREADTRIIMLSANGEEVDKVVGLEIGADNYMTKPVSMHELLAVVRARLRYRAPVAGAFVTRYSFGDVTVDFNALRATRAGQELDLTPREYDILQFLIRHRGKVVTRERLLDKLWGRDSFTSPRTIDNYLLKLRKKLEPDPATPRHILSVYGGGYKFAG
jgi:two-component system, OmpR family, response regulator VicR